MSSMHQIIDILQNISRSNQSATATPHDAYAINIANDRFTIPPLDSTSAPSGIIIPLVLRRYEFNPDTHAYKSTSTHVLFDFHVTSFYFKKDTCRTLPYLMDGFPTDITPELWQNIRHDPILRRLSTCSRLVFRYSPERNLGCLVHIGFDLMPIDGDDSLIPLWITATNLDKQASREP